MSSHGQSGEQKLIAGFFLGPSSFFRITPDKSLGPYRERAGGQRPANRKNARGRSVHDTATCTKPPRGLAGQLPYGDSIEKLCLANSVSAQAKRCMFAIALPNGVSPSQSTAPAA